MSSTGGGRWGGGARVKTIGLTRNFRDDLERAGISGSRNESGGYYRLRTETKRGVPRSRIHTHTLSFSLRSCLPSSGFLKNIDVTDNDAKQQLLGIVDILHKQGCRVVVDPAPESESPVATFLDQLREIECLHFAA